MKTIEFFFDFLFPPRIFYDPEHDFKGPGTPGAIKQAKKPIFPKIPKFPKNCKKYISNPLFGGPLKRAPWALKMGRPKTQSLGRDDRRIRLLPKQIF